MVLPRGPRLFVFLSPESTMTREKRRQSWFATLPGGTPIEGIMPDVILTRKALGMVPDRRLNDVATAMAEANDNILRLCIKQIGGDDVGYEKLAHGGLDRRLTPREKELVKIGFRRMRQPTEAELEWFEYTLTTHKDGRTWAWSGRILTGDDLDAYYEAEDALYDARAVLADVKDAGEALEQAEQAVVEAEEALSAAESKALEIEGVLQNSKIIRRCTEQVPSDLKKRGAAFVEKEVSENLIRNCVRKIDGQSVDYSDLKEIGLDEWLDTKEQNLIIYAIMKLGQPDEQEADDFLGTWEVG